MRRKPHLGSRPPQLRHGPGAKSNPSPNVDLASILRGKKHAGRGVKMATGKHGAVDRIIGKTVRGG